MDRCYCLCAHDRKPDLYNSTGCIYKEADSERSSGDKTTIIFSIKPKNMIEKKPSNDQSRKSPDNDLRRNRNEEGVDKAPGEERNKGEK